MSDRPTITVAIPAYNNAHCIRRSITSALASGADAVLLVDNASNDDTYTIASSYAPAVSVHRNETNIGQAPNWSRCVELCTTDWLLILHADDELVPNACDYYRAVITTHPDIGIIFADAYVERVGDPSSRVCATRTVPEGVLRAGPEAMFTQYGACSATMVRHEAYRRLGTFVPTSLSSDTEMWARITSVYDAYSLAQPTAVYYSSDQSVGPRSLVERSIAEIRSDWDDLAERIASVLPSTDAAEAFRAKHFRDGPGNYWPVFTANLRARNWRNVRDALILICITYRGLIPFLQCCVRSLHNGLRRRFHV